MANLSPYRKAIYSAVVTVVGACISVIAATPHHSFGDLDTLAWLTLVGTIIGVPGGTYAIKNAPLPAKRDARGRYTDRGQAGLLLVVVVVLLLLGAGGFALHVLWYVALVALIVWLVSLAVGGTTYRRRYW